MGRSHAGRRANSRQTRRCLFRHHRNTKVFVKKNDLFDVITSIGTHVHWLIGILNLSVSPMKNESKLDTHCP